MAVNSKTATRMAKVFDHLLATNLLLLHKLAETLCRSIMITCTVKLKIMTAMIPGITKKINPRIVNADTIMPEMRRVGRLDRTEFSPTLKVAGLPSNISEDIFMTIPLAIEFMTQPMTTDATNTGIIAIK